MKDRITNSFELMRPVPKYPMNLPILEHREKIVSLLKTNQVIIVAGETGSGKTTQLPVFCLEAGFGVYRKIGCTQPRRIAATSIASRVAHELGCTLGREVGYKIRFSDMDQPQTSIKFMTDGILLAEIERDPQLKLYDVLIIDEAHERSLNIDFILGYLRKLLPSRKDLKIIISSATIDTELFSKSFNNAPVIEVSGRMYPVEVLYLDPAEDAQDEDKEDVDYLNATVRAVRDVTDMYGGGDMLIFMPTERDIRETCDKLNGLHLNETEILPLFSRLSRGEQDLIFKTINKRKIVVATNIAETSITVPGIQFVIDTGLARISRYIPRLRTNRLPIEPISRAAAKQRMGRCGRVMDGVCVRLFSEKEFNEREQFTLPEIKRSNLASVVLSMIAHRLGTIDVFPFLEPPSKQAVAEAYAQLKELGAIDVNKQLTSLGREMAQLPLDPHIGRMVLAASKEGALREVKIIAAALSIVDPRERPFDKQAEADAMHKKFHDPSSDFMLYVKLWDSYQQEWQTLKTQGKMRKFCKDHFLSFVRMQEWHDVHQQLNDTLNRMQKYSENSEPALYDAIHRSLLTGLLTNCAMKNEHGRYTAARGREVLVFPGSVLAQKKIDWIMCHEIVETSQVFARTVAVVNPLWLEEIGGHLCSRSYSEPYFEAETGSVKANETVSLLGLPVACHVGIRYGRINAAKATDVFIWKGLVEEALDSYQKFYVHNKKVRKDIEVLEAKLRTKSLFAGEQAIADFYNGKLTNVSSTHDLNRFVKDLGDSQILFMSQEDILAAPLPDQSKTCPDIVDIGGKTFPLKYSFVPGAEHDGVTMTIPVRDAPFIPGDSLGWLVPHLWPERITELLQCLPKETRRKLMPLSENARDIAAVLKISPESFNVSVAKAVKILYGIEIDPDKFSEDKISPHLSLRVEVSNDKGEVVASGRDASVLSMLSLQKTSFGNSAWEKAVLSHERLGITEWNFGDLADCVEIASSENGIPLYGYPFLSADDECVNLTMAKSAEDAQRQHREGIRCLLEITMATEFVWVERELRFTQSLKLLCAPLGGAEKIKNVMVQIIKEHLLTTPVPLPRKQAYFVSAIASIKKQAAGIGYEALSLIEKNILLYNDCLSRISKESRPRLSELKKELKLELLYYFDCFVKGTITFDAFRQYPRYLKAFGYRIERAFNEPLKYSEKKNVLNLYRARIDEIMLKSGTCIKQEYEHFSSMLQELAISLFAQQEVRTLFPVSEKRLDKKLEEIGQMVRKIKNGK
jgi:ATP-dependent helicase HrpA